MEVYIIAFLLLIVLAIGLLIWVIRLFLLYRKGKKKTAVIELIILLAILVPLSWEFHIFPFSKNFYIKDRTTELTGYEFWSWKEFDFEEMSVRGEGYTLNIYRFSEETAELFKKPDHAFLNDYPPRWLADKRWAKTPIEESEKKILEFVTPLYAGWEGEIVARQEFIRQIANQPGAYYSYDNAGSTNFYLIVPEKMLVILINHNM